MNLLELDDCIVYGYNFNRQEECPETIIHHFNPHSGKVKIAVTHTMITDEKSIVVDGQMKTINFNAINTNYDMVLCGHYHPGFGVKTNPFGTVFVNPGAMIRLSYDKFDTKRKPQFVLIEVKDKNVEAELIELPHEKDVWDQERTAQIEKFEEQKSEFADALASLNDEDFMAGNILELIDSVSKKKEVKSICSRKVIKMCKDKILELSDESTS